LGLLIVALFHFEAGQMTINFGLHSQFHFVYSHFIYLAQLAIPLWQIGVET
jgi:hypothetical protein